MLSKVVSCCTIYIHVDLKVALMQYPDVHQFKQKWVVVLQKVV